MDHFDITMSMPVQLLQPAKSIQFKIMENAQQKLLKDALAIEVVSYVAPYHVWWWRYGRAKNPWAKHIFPPMLEVHNDSMI